MQGTDTGPGRQFDKNIRAMLDSAETHFNTEAHSLRAILLRGTKFNGNLLGNDDRIKLVYLRLFQFF